MHIKFTAALCATLAATLATPALAQDMSSAPADTTEKAYNGVYVGASGGYDVQKNDIGSAIGFDRNGDGNFRDAVPTAAGADAFSPGYCNGKARGATLTANGVCENDLNRGSYYGRAGVDRQFGPFVVGLVGEFGRSDIIDYVSAFSTTPASYTFSRAIDWEASGGVRGGFAADQTLFYATGRFGYARLKHGFRTTNTTNSFSTLLDDLDRKGFVVGGCIEQRFMKHFSFGIEYTYHDYKDSEYLVRATQGSAAANNPFVLAPFTSGTTLRRADDNFRWHSLRATVGYHF